MPADSLVATVRPEMSLLEIAGYTIFSFVLSLILTPWFVSMLKKNNIGKQMRVETVDGKDPTIFLTYHQSKFGTPTMGGILIWISILLTVFASRVFSLLGWVDHSLLQRGQVYLPLFVLVSLGILGGIDDYLNIRGIGKNRGLNVLPKVLSLLVISFVGALWFYTKLNINQVDIPYVGSLFLGWWYVPIFMFILFGTANAVNVTDGLDGLAGGLLVIAFGAFGLLAYVEGLMVLAAFCAVCMGAIAAFLWHNVPPALFFMGDTGSLALGGTLAVMAMMIDRPLILPLVGFVFVIEMLSVIIQLLSKKLRGGKKVFLAAPLHHHFEALEWGESKVTMRLWIIGAFASMIGILIGIFG